MHVMDNKFQWKQFELYKNRKFNIYDKVRENEELVLIAVNKARNLFSANKFFWHDVRLLFIYTVIRLINFKDIDEDIISLLTFQQQRSPSHAV